MLLFISLIFIFYLAIKCLKKTENIEEGYILFASVIKRINNILTEINKFLFYFFVVTMSAKK